MSPRRYILLTAILILILGLAACATPPPAPTFAPTTAPTEIAAPSATPPPPATAAPTPVAGGAIEIPAPGARATLPLHILARAGEPGAEVIATLRWEDGGELVGRFILLHGEDARGLLIDNLDWVNMLQPPLHPTQPATLTIRDSAGTILAEQQLTLVSADDPETREVMLYWSVTGAPTVQPQQRRIMADEPIAVAALEELLWGPPAISQVGFVTAIPTPAEVLSYPGRQPGWGPRVTLRSLVIADGVATADFSPELRAYGGGSARVQLIRAQIEQTLQQFPEVDEVRIAVAGQIEGALEP